MCALEPFHHLFRSPLHWRTLRYFAREQLRQLQCIKQILYWIMYQSIFILNVFLVRVHRSVHCSLFIVCFVRHFTGRPSCTSPLMLFKPMFLLVLVSPWKYCSWDHSFPKISNFEIKNHWTSLVNNYRYASLARTTISRNFSKSDRFRPPEISNSSHFYPGKPEIP